MKKLVILSIGIPGSGKTTALSALSRKYRLCRVSRDDIRQEWFGNPHLQERKDAVRREAERRMMDALANGDPVVLDSTFVDAPDRRRNIQKARESGAERVIGIIFTTSLSRARANNRQRTFRVSDQVIERKHQKLLQDPPKRSEGFDALYTSEQLDLLEQGELKGKG